MMNLPLWGFVILLGFVGLLTYLSRKNRMAIKDSNERAEIGELADKQDITTVIARLKNGRSREKLEAIDTVVKILPGEAGPLLVEALADKNEEVRMSAAGALIELKDDSTVPMLINALREPEKWLPARIAEVLSAIGDSAVTSLRVAVKDENDLVRAYAIQILGIMSVPEITELAINKLKDDSVEVRRAASMVLAEQNCNQHVPELAQAAGDPDKRVRVQVVRALGKTGSQAAIEALIPSINDEDWGVAVSAVEALASIGGRGDEELMRIAGDSRLPVSKRAAELIKKKGHKPTALINITYGTDKD